MEDPLNSSPAPQHIIPPPPSPLLPHFSVIHSLAKLCRSLIKTFEITDLSIYP